MPVDFLDAYERHWEDAELLFDEKRWANAVYLYGLSVECGIKALLERTGRRVPYQHLPDLARNYRRFEFRHRGYPRIKLPSAVRTGFDDWTIEMRYYRRNDFSERKTTQYRNGARAMHGLVKRLKAQGWLP